MPRDSVDVLKIFRFIEALTIPSGIGKGEPFTLRQWQRSFIRAVYGPRKAGRRVVRRAILSMGRKNGKTMLTAALSLVHLLGPESEPNGRIYSAANDNAQAALIFEYMEQLIKAEPELLTYLDVIPSTKTIRAVDNGSVYRALSAEAGTKYGLNPTMVIYDELSQAANTRLYDALATSMGARKEPLFIIISTQSADPQHILSQLIDQGLSQHDRSTYCRLYTVPEAATAEADDHLTNERKWKLANPALGDFRDLDEMRMAADEAIRLPVREAAFRNLYLNQRIHAESPLIPRAEWLACKGEATIRHGERVYLGLDLSGTTDLTALVAVSADGGDRVLPVFWKPQAMLIEHEGRDRVPYTVWKAQGHLDTTPGSAIEYEWVAHRIMDLAKTHTVVGMAFDRYRIDYIKNAFTRVGFEWYEDGKDEPRAGALRLVGWGQGYKDMTPAVEALEASVLQRRLVHDGHPVLTWNISNAICISDPAGNRKLDKSAVRFRIDGVVALAMAVGLKSRDLATAPQPSAYEGRSVAELIERMGR